MLANNEKYKLRLVLGIGRSGTTWVGKSLSQGIKESTRYLEEPMFRYSPKIQFNKPPDHTAIKSDAGTIENLILNVFYKNLCSKKFKIHIDQKFTKRDDPNPETILVKEVHSLLGLKSLLINSDTSVLFIKRSVFEIVDSIIHAQGVETPYLVNEYKSISQVKSFYPKLVRHIESQKDIKIKVIMRKIFCCIYIFNYVDRLTDKYRNLLILKYEALCHHPEENFKRIAEFFKVELEPNSYIFDADDDVLDSKSPYSVVRSISDQINSTLKVITPSEKDFITIEFSKFDLDLNDFQWK